LLLKNRRTHATELMHFLFLTTELMLFSFAMVK
jgi:hypothetical protein